MSGPSLPEKSPLGPPSASENAAATAALTGPSLAQASPAKGNAAAPTNAQGCSIANSTSALPSALRIQIAAANLIDDHAEQEDFLASQARAVGITPDHIDLVSELLGSGRLTYQEVLGLSAQEMAALAARGQQLMQQNEPRRALRLFMALIELDPYDMRYIRSAGICLQQMKQYGFALGFYNFAVATAGTKDFVCQALSAECLFHLEGKQAGLKALADVLAYNIALTACERPYHDRAQALQKRLQLSASQKT